MEKKKCAITQQALPASQYEQHCIIESAFFLTFPQYVAGREENEFDNKAL